jgi:hypothetical protein
MLAESLPISHAQAHRAAKWMIDNFDEKLARAIVGTVFKKKHLCAIACQETAYVWIGWLNKLDTTQILARCVFDASGDASGTSRSVFPKNTAEFRAKFGKKFTAKLIEEGNATRKLRGYAKKQWVYKGYGLFQYDLQYVLSDEAFFRNKHWYSFETCLAKAVSELKRKYAATGDIWKAIKAYNGSGAKAEQYMRNVKSFTRDCADVTHEA